MCHSFFHPVNYYDGCHIVNHSILIDLKIKKSLKKIPDFSNSQNQLNTQ